MRNLKEGPFLKFIRIGIDLFIEFKIENRKILVIFFKNNAFFILRKLKSYREFAKIMNKVLWMIEHVKSGL